MGAFTNSEQEAWAEASFGQADLGDRRRTRRAVLLAASMLRHPAASLPRQTGAWSATKAGYRFFDQEAVTLEALQTPHWQATREEARTRDVVLMIEDTSELDYTFHWDTEGLGPIGNGKGRGFLLHSTMAVDPDGVGEVLGLAYQMVFCREPQPQKKTETRTERKHRKRESHIWPTSVREVGASGTASRWILVADRGADTFETLEACEETRTDFLIRVAQSRRAALGHKADQPSGQLLDLARSLPASTSKDLALRARPKRKQRVAKLSIAFSDVTIFAPWLSDRKDGPLRCWLVRVWEENPPPKEDPIEWILLTSVSVKSKPMAVTMTDWYAMRWLVEEYHKCLKTGCSVEKRQLQEADRLKGCIGMLAVVAVRLLQLKLLAKAQPDLPAMKCAPRQHVEILAAYRQCSPQGWTVYEFWREVAKLGGFLGRKSDGEPGWQTLWRGWQQLDLMTLGAQLVTRQ